ncbi:MAG: carbohydrate ABC transporter permease [Acidimicrobiia bacterium]|nr:carbohydrate ABC transporter permease [Acidimicrobiia bacterium]
MTTTAVPPETRAEPDIATISPPPKQSWWRSLAQNWPVKLVVLVIVVIWIVPTLGVLISSFRPPDDVNASGWWSVLPDIWNTDWTLVNYDDVLSSEGFGNSFLNSLAVTIPATVIPITIAAFAAYAFAWMEFPGRQWIFVGVVALLVIPLQMSLIPLLRIYTTIDLNGTFLAVWLAHTGFGLPLAIYLLRNYIGSLPSSIIESAQIDGASHFQIFTQLVVPLSVPVLASFAIFQFLWVWNDLLIALVFLGGERQVRVVTQALAELNGSRGQAWHLLTAGAFITMALPLAVFFSLQRFFVRGLTAGSVKG